MVRGCSGRLESEEGVIREQGRELPMIYSIIRRCRGLKPRRMRWVGHVARFGREPANVKITWETWARIAGDIELRCGHEGAKGLSGLVWLWMESFGGLL
jgi:hypothetical protein